ncbi:hypothetical protein H5410_056616 [Solanum commersonii]|uniref:Uncharacterized protein n=1 Tax=Solanum commersonii TaxID=4109 RepID=A0A9J5WLT9_SOLCO|nr:hypothetical protein H5410_056616 [Solanum commersonii]
MMCGYRVMIKLHKKLVNIFRGCLLIRILINKEKIHFMVPVNTSQDIINNIQEVTGFSQKDSPITYLGCPLYIGRQRIIYYSQLVEKVSKKVCGWQARLLNFGGKITLVKHALQSIPGLSTQWLQSHLPILLSNT